MKAERLKAMQEAAKTRYKFAVDMFNVDIEFIPVENLKKKIDFEKVKKFSKHDKRIKKIPLHIPQDRRVLISPALVPDPPKKEFKRHKAVYTNLPSPMGIASELHSNK